MRRLALFVLLLITLNLFSSRILYAASQQLNKDNAPQAGADQRSATIDRNRPTIDSVSPVSGAAGTKVIISGSSFGASSGQVTFGGLAAVAQWTQSGKSIVTAVPNGLKSGKAVVVVTTSGGVKSNKKTFTIQAAPVASSCDPQSSISLGVLNGTDADGLAQTLNGVFRAYVVSGFAKPKAGKSASDASSDSSTDQPSNPDNALCVRTGDGKLARIKQDDPIVKIAAILDRDSFRGGILNSNFIVHKDEANFTQFADGLMAAFGHPVPDIDVFSLSAGSTRYIILLPTPMVLGINALQQTLAKDIAGLKRDFLLLYDLFNQRTNALQSACDESCFARRTVQLSTLDPRDVALNAGSLGFVVARVFPLNNAIVLLPTGSTAGATTIAVDQTNAAIEQFELYQQTQQRKQLLASSQSGSGSSGSPSNASPTTMTTTSTTKTSVSPPSAGGAGNSNTKASGSSTTSVTTKTSTLVQPGPSSTQSVTGQSAPSAIPAPTGGNNGAASVASVVPAGSIGSPSSAAQAAASQPTAPPWNIDNVVRLYDYRDAVGIAAAINGAATSSSSSNRPIVQALTDFGANDLVEIFPQAAQQNGYTVGDIERAIALIDLPRPQLSLQVWSYQVSSKVTNPEKPYKSAFGRTLKKYPDGCSQEISGNRQFEDDARFAVRNLHATVDKANRAMAAALERGMEAIFDEARTRNPFFDVRFHDYLTSRYRDCVKQDHYCLGYFDALDYPKESSPSGAIKASLGRVFLFIAASHDNEAPILVAKTIAAMRKPYQREPEIPFERLEEQLQRVAQRGNLHLLRGAMIEFFFNFKWTLNYPNDFVPYDLRISAHSLDDLLQPIVNAFNQDIDDYVEMRMNGNKCLIPKNSKAGLISQGMVQVAALSGSPATVSGQVSNYFNITQTPSLSQVATMLGGPGSGAGSAGSGPLQSLMSSNPYVLAGTALANMVSPQAITAQLTRGVTLSIVPTSLDTASGAELNVNLLVDEPDGTPQSVNATAATQDTLDRVAMHSVNDTVRVQSLKLFDLSTLTMEITHPLPRTCFPVADDEPARTFSMVAAVPLSVPCAVWRSIFGSMPIAGRLFEWPRSPVTVDNRSVAIVRAVVVPTAMDLGEALNYESDRIEDPVTRTTESLFAIQQLGWKARKFHQLMVQSIVNDNVNGYWPRLSTTPEDERKPATN